MYSSFEQCGRMNNVYQVLHKCILHLLSNITRICHFSALFLNALFENHVTSSHLH